MNKNNQNETATNASHFLQLDNQNKLKITGISQVISATQKCVVCKLAQSHLQISGENLHVDKLSPEDKLLEVSGLVEDIKYIGSAKSSFMKKLFR